MSVIKSFSVGNGDMFYIEHASDNFTIIDCFLNEDNKERIIGEVVEKANRNSNIITRFISTHPDNDHIGGIKDLDEAMEILNFYCVKNEFSKENSSEDLKKYCELRDSEKKSYYISKGCKRKWMNQQDDTRGSSGISILWPNVDNEDFKEALKKAKEGGSPNNISPIIKYSLENGITALWMGDMEKDFLEKIEEEIDWPSVDILFAPHHGRDSAKVPKEYLDKMNPQIIIIGEAQSEYLNYYQGWNTITQNSAGDIILDCETNKVHIYVSNQNYSVGFLSNEDKKEYDYYIGTLSV